MGIVFVEYRIEEGRKEEYLSCFRKLLTGEDSSCEWFEGTDQPGLFVEMWHGMSFEDAEAMKERRRNPADPVWSILHGMVSGGVGKLHIWHFKKVR